MHKVDQIAAPFGGVPQLAERLGMRTNAVHQWKSRGIPKERRWDIRALLRKMRDAGEISHKVMVEATEALEAEDDEVDPAPAARCLAESP